MKFMTYLLMVAGALLLGSGCVSTPGDRIKKDPQLFATFAPEVQAKVQKGEIELGYSRGMVRLALGAPPQVNVRTTETGDIEIWTYFNTRYISSYEPLNAGYWYRDRAGRLQRSYDTMWVNRGWYEDVPVLRLEFVGDKLKAMERAKK